MNQQEHSVLKTAQEWIVQIEMQKKLNKQAKSAVISFAIWLDNLIIHQETRKEIENGKEN